jgi:hypothetical protein
LVEKVSKTGRRVSTAEGSPPTMVVSCLATAPAWPPDGRVDDVHAARRGEGGEFDCRCGQAGSVVDEDGAGFEGVQQSAFGEDLEVVLVLAQAQSDDVAGGAHVGHGLVCGVGDAVEACEAPAA